jgi:hypothetical protein
MATHPPATRFALRPVLDRRLPDGAWSPENLTLNKKLGQLFASWPPDARASRRTDGQPARDDEGGHL